MQLYEDCERKYGTDAIVRTRNKARKIANFSSAAPPPPGVAEQAPKWQTEIPERIPNVFEVIKLLGEVDLYQSPRVAKELGSLLPANIIVDCRELKYIDSSGLAVLIEGMQNAEAAGCRFGLLGLQDSVRPIFEIARLDQILELVADKPESFHPFTKASYQAINRQAAVQVEELNQELMSHFAKHPESLYHESPRRFEEVVMEILRDRGCDVEHVGGGGDLGRDIIATLNTPIGRMLIVVQCKRYSPDRPIQPDMLRSFMFVVNDVDKASYGLFATTSFFGPGSLAIQREFRHRLGLADFERLKEWLTQYGKWKMGASNSNLWVPGEIRPLSDDAL
jgi:anti-anti-sigma factor